MLASENIFQMNLPCTELQPILFMSIIGQFSLLMLPGFRSEFQWNNCGEENDKKWEMIENGNKFSALNINQIYMHSFTVDGTVPEQDSNKQRLSSGLFEMVKQISNLITNLIGNANFIYESYGIDFDLSNMHQVMLRLMTPSQLLTYSRIDATGRFPQKLFIKNFPRHSFPTHPLFNYKTSINYDTELVNILQGKFQEKTSPEPIQQETKVQTKQLKKVTPTTVPVPAPEKQQAKQDNEEDSEKWKFVEVRRQGMKPILGIEGERRLCYWVYDQLKKDQRLLLKDIARQAKVIGKHIPGFGASISWVHRFFDRYPDLYELYKSKKEQYEQKSIEQQKLKRKDEQDNKSDTPQIGKTLNKTFEGSKNLIYDDDEDEFEQIVYPKSKPKQSAKNRVIPTCQPLKSQNSD